MKRTFEIKRHEEYGNVGLAPRWMSADQRDPLTGMGVAHDILEHGSDDRVEWQGLGGAIFVRGETGYFSRDGRRNTDPVENIASDFTQLFHYWCGKELPSPGKTRPLAESWAEQMVCDVVDRGAGLVRSEYGRDDYHAKNVRQFCSEANKEAMRGWLRRGYRAAAKRWKNVGSGMLYETFCEIEEAVDVFLKHAEGYEGHECTIDFNPATATVLVSAELERDDYDD